MDTVPRPTVHWKYNGAPLDVSNTSKYHVNPRTARLFISVVTQSDEGEYSCTLSNIEGSVNSGAGTLTVMDMPSGVCVCVCVCEYMYVLELKCCETHAVSCCAGNPEKPGYLAEPGRDTGRIEVLEGTELIVECVANTSSSDVLYRWTYPSGIADFRSG